MIEPFAHESLPGRVIFGAGRIAAIPAAVESLGATRALVLSTPGHSALAEKVSSLLGELSAGVFAGAVMHTPFAVTGQALQHFSVARADCLVAIGGGSAIGLGKAIALRTDAPQVAVSTTYAGSEMTPILGETEGGVKKTQRSAKTLPEIVIYDPDLTLSLPPKTSAASGLNAMAHAAEALYARDCSPITSLIAEEGLRAFAKSLPRIVADPGDGEARAAALYGAWLCGSCLAAVGMALHHKLCHVLGGAFDLPHAETHAIVLPHALAYNASAAPEAMARIAAALGALDAAAGVYDLAERLGVPLALRDIGMPADGIDRALELALQDPYWNPRPLEAAGLRRLLERAYEGHRP